MSVALLAILIIPLSNVVLAAFKLIKMERLSKRLAL